MLKESPIKVGSILGEGLNAYVYKATCDSKELDVHQNYALKVLKRKSDLKHFKKEFQTLVNSRGSHLVRLYGWRTYKKKPALLLEYIDGVTLEELLSQFSMTDEESNWIYHEVIAGLLELKSQELFHGDLSPKNIMISKDGEIKLIDFGLTKWRTKQIEVTPEFASPKLLQGDLPSFNHDFYALNKIFSTFKLYKSESASLEAPQSLKDKVLSFSESCSTQSFDLEPKLSHRSWAPKLKFLSLMFSGLAFINPLSADNSIPKLSHLHIRSSNWMSVKSMHQKDWCFTPCTLKLPHLGLHKIYWKSQTSSGMSKAYITHDGETLIIK